LFDVESEVKYEGYIQRNLKELAQIDKSENLILSKDFNYSLIKGLSSEAIEKLSAIRPESLGQAKRISGITPSDITVLSINLSKTRRFT
jgi:NAD/FAD-utilizing enzyme apparently involved in cell division